MLALCLTIRTHRDHPKIRATMHDVISNKLDSSKVMIGESHIREIIGDMMSTHQL